MTPEADPIVTAVAGILAEHFPGAPVFDIASVAVTAHRRAVLDQRDDGERWARLGEMAQAKLAKSPAGAEVVHVRHAMLREMLDLLAALADAEIARRQAEAAVQRLRQSHEDCDRTYADLTADRDELLDELRAEQAGLPEWSPEQTQRRQLPATPRALPR